MGKALLKNCFLWAKTKAANEICLSVTLGESSAMSLYQTLGFYSYGEIESLRSGSNIKTQQMKLNLSKLVLHIDE